MTSMHRILNINTPLGEDNAVLMAMSSQEASDQPASAVSTSPMCYGPQRLAWWGNMAYSAPRTAQTLHVDIGQLSKRVARGCGAMRTASAAPQFVELLAQPVLNAVTAFPCIVEMQNARGGKMRVELSNIDGLAGLTAAFWSAR